MITRIYQKHLKRKYIGVIFCAVVILAVIYVIFRSGGEDFDFIETVNKDAISANVLILSKTEKSDSISYSAGLSGVIFRKDSENYYVLTALHGIPLDSELNDTKLIVLGYDQLTYGEADVNIDLTAYYSQFPEAILEYYDDAYDLAVVSFVSDKEYTVLSVASRPPEYNQPVAAIGNPHGNSRNTVTTGKITSRKPVPFGDKAGANQHNIVEHSAKTSVGGSGGALLNKDLEIVGIHLGGGENIFHRYINGKAMPCDRILDFLSGMDTTKNFKD